MNQRPSRGSVCGFMHGLSGSLVLEFDSFKIWICWGHCCNAYDSRVSLHTLRHLHRCEECLDQLLLMMTVIW